MRKSGFGPVIAVAAILLFVVVALGFSSLIFGSVDQSTNTSNMSADAAQAYNATTGIVQTGMTVWDVVMWLLVGGVIIGAGFFLVKMVA